MADAGAPVTDASADAAAAEIDRLHAFQKQKAGESGISTFLEALGLHMCHGLLEALLRKVHDLPALKDLSEDALALAVAPLNLKPKGIKFKKLWSALEQLRAENSTIFVPTMVAEPEMQKNGMMERPLVQPLDYHTSVTHESASMDAMPAPPRPGLGYNMKYLGPAAAFPSLFNPGTSTAAKEKVAKIKEGIKLKREGKAIPPPLLPTDQPIEGVWRSELAKELLDLANMFGHANEGSKRPEVAAAKARAAAADCAKSAAADAAQEAPKAFRGVGAPLTNALRNMGQYMHMFESDEVADVKFTKHESEAKAQSSRKSQRKKGKKGKAKSQRTERDKENAAPQHKESAVSKMIEKNKTRLLNFMHKENKACAGERRTKDAEDIPCAGERHFVDHDSIKCAGERHVKNADEKVCAGVRHLKDADEKVCAGVRHLKDADEKVCAGLRHVKDDDEKVCAGVRHVKDADEKVCAGVRHVKDADHIPCAGERRVKDVENKPLPTTPSKLLEQLWGAAQNAASDFGAQLEKVMKPADPVREVEKAVKAAAKPLPPPLKKLASNRATTKENGVPMSSKRASGAPISKRANEAPISKRANDALISKRANDAPISKRANDAPISKRGLSIRANGR